MSPLQTRLFVEPIETISKRCQISESTAKEIGINTGELVTLIDPNTSKDITCPADVSSEILDFSIKVASDLLTQINFTGIELIVSKPTGGFKPSTTPPPQPTPAPSPSFTNLPEKPEPTTSPVPSPVIQPGMSPLPQRPQVPTTTPPPQPMPTPVSHSTPSPGIQLPPPPKLPPTPGIPKPTPTPQMTPTPSIPKPTPTPQPGFGQVPPPSPMQGYGQVPPPQPSQGFSQVPPRPQPGMPQVPSGMPQQTGYGMDQGLGDGMAMAPPDPYPNRIDVNTLLNKNQVLWF